MVGLVDVFVEGGGVEGAVGVVEANLLHQDADQELGQEDFGLILAAVLQQSLDNSAAVGMARNVESLELCIPLRSSFYKTILLLLPSRHNDPG